MMMMNLIRFLYCCYSYYVVIDKELGTNNISQHYKKYNFAIDELCILEMGVSD